MFASRPAHLPRLNKRYKVSIAGIAAAGAASLAVSLATGSAPASADTVTHPTVAAAPAARTTSAAGTHGLHAGAVKEHAGTQKAAAAHTEAPAHVHGEAHAHAQAHTAARMSAHVQAAAHRHVYANDLNGWIHESLAVMKAHHIPGSYSGLHRNIMRESSGNPDAKNGWDTNAQNGTPSIGLLQVIQPTFNAYHVSGTSDNIYQPVSNIVAAANYAAHTYGSINNVNGPY